MIWIKIYSIFSKEIILTTTKSVLKLSVERCNRLNTNNLCLAAMDPYCIWDNNQQRCILYTKSSSTFPRSLTCPILNTTSMCLFIEFLSRIYLFSRWWLDIVVSMVYMWTSNRWKMSMSYKNMYTTRFARSSELGGKLPNFINFSERFLTFRILPILNTFSEFFLITELS